MHRTKRSGWRTARDLRACTVAELDHMRQTPAVLAELDRRRERAVQENREAKERAAMHAWADGAFGLGWLYVGAAMLKEGK